MEEDKRQILTFNYQKIINIKEIQQGDIFKNIPYYSPDVLVRSSLNEFHKKIDNEAESIFKKVIENGEVIKVKSIIFPTWAILGSQECDIRRGYDLIFFPLVKRKDVEQKDLEDFIDNGIGKMNRFMYIPKRDISDNKFGPFKVLLQNPFYISYEIIEKNLEHCWATHIIEKARRVFVGKIANLFTRTPVDELVFIEFDNIENYFQEKWRKAWNRKRNPDYDEKVDIITDKIIEFYILLKHENEQTRFQEFKIVPFNIIKDIKNLTYKYWIFNEKNPFISYYTQLEENKTINCFNRFYKFIDNTIYGEDSIFKTFENHLNKIKQFVGEEEYLDYKEINIGEEHRKLPKDRLISKLDTLIIKEQEYLSYFKPFEKLKKFLTEIGIFE